MNRSCATEKRTAEDIAHYREALGQALEILGTEVAQ